MIPKDDQCYYCDSIVVEIRRVCIDAEPNDEGNMQGVYTEVGLCEEHCMEHEEQVGLFDPFKYR